MPRLAASCGLLAALVFVPSSALAATITLTGVIRDFLPAGSPTAVYNGTEGTGHPDFESQTVSYGLDTTVVEPTLGSDGKPVYGTDAAGGNNSTTGVTTFSQWFNDTAGVNLSQSYSIVLDDTGSPGLYTYESTSFFPIDGQLYGNNPGLDRNYGFTFELNTTFGYQPGQTFSFMGDDDIFVFIDGQRVINLGGVHAAMGETVNLDTLGLVAGNNYSLSIFFAERHTIDSWFKIQTSIALTQVDTPIDPDPTPVPEPASLLLVGAGLAALAARSRR